MSGDAPAMLSADSHAQRSAMLPPFETPVTYTRSASALGKVLSRSASAASRKATSSVALRNASSQHVPEFQLRPGYGASGEVSRTPTGNASSAPSSRARATSRGSSSARTLLLPPLPCSAKSTGQRASGSARSGSSTEYSRLSPLWENAVSVRTSSHTGGFTGAAASAARLARSAAERIAGRQLSARELRQAESGRGC